MRVDKRHAEAQEWAERVMIAVRQRYPNHREALPELLALMRTASVGDDPEDLERELWAALKFTMDDGARLPTPTFASALAAFIKSIGR